MAINVTTHQAATVPSSTWGILARLTSGTVAALFERPDQLSEALSSLVHAGIEAESVEVVQTRDARNLNAGGRFTSWIAALGAERAIFHQYHEEVEAGSTMLLIHDLPVDLRHRAAAMLRASGGRFINDFGRFTVRMVAP